jgi:hypothetical protein
MADARQGTAIGAYAILMRIILHLHRNPMRRWICSTPNISMVTVGPEAIMSKVKLSTRQQPFPIANVARRVLTWIWCGLMTRDERYCPEKFYMRGPGPKWREKQLAMRRQRGL